MSLKQDIDADLKAAMLNGDKVLATTLRGLKSAILDEEIKKGARDTGLSDDEVTDILVRETKKRQESADMYEQGGDAARADAEKTEKTVIAKYLPQQMSEDELRRVVDEVIQTVGNDPKNMGQIIGGVKARVKAAADGATVARIVKEQLS